MAVPLCRLEGTWQEIAARVPNFNTRKLEVLVYDAEEAQQTLPVVPSVTTTEPPIQKTLADVLREIQARNQHIHPKTDQRDYLREARSGAMFGLELNE